MEKRAAIKLCVKLKKRAIEMFKMSKSVYGEEYLSRTDVFEWHRRSTKSKSRCKTMNENAVLQLPEQKNRRKSFKSVLPKIQI
jgi:hypothetical protein